MTYARRTQGLSGCSCSGGRGVPKKRGVLAGLGIDLAAVTASSSDVDPATLLRAEVNRFADPGAPAGFFLFTAAAPPTGPVDFQVATMAGQVLARYLQSQSNLGVSTSSQLVALEASVIGDTTGSFTAANIQQITGIVSGYADANGLPNAKLPGQIIPGYDNVTVAVAAGAAGLLLYYLSK
jgi:hypothetical protein